MRADVRIPRSRLDLRHLPRSRKPLHADFELHGMIVFRMHPLRQLFVVRPMRIRATPSLRPKAGCPTPDAVILKPTVLVFVG